MPNVGTGYVDWGQYVGANQATTDRDRQKVADYMQGQDKNARAAASNAFGQSGYNNLGAQQGAGSDAWNQWINEVNTNQSALQSPEGFEEVLAKANAAYDPTGKDKAPQAAYDPFSANLEGQNAGKLYSGAGDVQKFAEDQKGATRGPGSSLRRPTLGTPASPSGVPEGPSGKPSAGSGAGWDTFDYSGPTFDASDPKKRKP